jgi:rod shape-determining protein MreC
MLKRPSYIAAGVVVVLTLVLLNLPTGTSVRLKSGLSHLFAPLFGVSKATHTIAGHTGDALLPRRELLRQLEALREENQELRIKATQTEELEQQNARLRNSLGLQKTIPGRLRLSRVILRDPANWWRTVQIDVGSREGVQVNMAVLTPEGALAGRVSSVGPTRSQVVLLGDPGCKVAVRVQETRDTGVIGGAGPLGGDIVEMGYLSRTANLKPGQKVITCGDGGVFPPNISVGQVVDSQAVEYDQAKAARVKLTANLGSLEEVWVKVE